MPGSSTLTVIGEWPHIGYVIKAEHTSNTVCFFYCIGTQKSQIKPSRIQINLPTISLGAATLTQATTILALASVKFDDKNLLLKIDLFSKKQANLQVGYSSPPLDSAIAYEIEIESIPVGSERRRIIRNTINTWNSYSHHTGLRFIPHTDELKTIVFTEKISPSNFQSPDDIEYVYCQGKEDFQIRYQLNQLLGIQPASAEAEINYDAMINQQSTRFLKKVSLIPAHIKDMTTSVNVQLMRQPEWKTLQYKGVAHLIKKEYAKALNFYSALYDEYKTVFSTDRIIALINICTICAALSQDDQSAKKWNEKALKKNSQHPDTLKVSQGLKQRWTSQKRKKRT